MPGERPRGQLVAVPLNENGQRYVAYTSRRTHTTSGIPGQIAELPRRIVIHDPNKELEKERTEQFRRSHSPHFRQAQNSGKPPTTLQPAFKEDTDFS